MVLLAQRPAPKKVPKQSIEVIAIRDHQARMLGSETLQHVELGARFKVSEDEARQLVIGAAALYVLAEDDFTPDQRLTITPDRLAAIECTHRMIKARRAESEEDAAVRAAERRALIAKYAQPSG